MALPLSPQVFAIMNHLIADAAGLHYDVKDAELLAEKLSARAIELGLESLLDYYYFLRYDAAGPRELEALIELLVVNETYFFRERDQLEVFVTELAPELLETRRSLRIWCAACSTGEEPHTLAMLLADHGLLDRAEIVATDISSRALTRAREGAYGERSLRALGEAERSRYFVHLGDGRAGVRTELRSAIRWERVNLLDAARVQTLGTFDAVLCRNVLIYFTDATIVALVQRLARSLSPGGLLLIGASESLLRFGTVFDCEERGGAFFYRWGGA